MCSTLHAMTALLKPPTEHEDGRVLEQIWTAVKTITTISTRARTAAVHQIVTHPSDLIIPVSDARCDSALHSTANRRKE